MPNSEGSAKASSTTVLLVPVSGPSSREGADKSGAGGM